MSPVVDPVRKSVTVPLAPAAAFELFTAGLHRWWPVATHSIGRDAVSACRIEPRVGGAIYEEHENGTRCTWGRIVAWSPPDSFVTTWHPGRDPSQEQVVEVRFVAVDDGCRVDLEHRGWEALGDDALEVRDRYDNGWVPVLAAYVDAASRSGEGDAR